MLGLFLSADLARQPSQRLQRAREARALWRPLALCSMTLCSSACELVLGGIPKDDFRPPDAQVERDAGDAASAFDDLDAGLWDAGEASVPPPSDGGSDAQVQDADVPVEVDAGSGADAGEDASTPIEDSGMPDASTPPDAGEPDAGPPCTLITWYADDDGDGEGSATKTTKACLKPAGKWVAQIKNGGDCADGDARAYHGQTTYFGTGYQLPGGKVSFDFDCSGQEEPWAGQALAAAACDQLNCKGTGYAKTARTGAGVYAYCGSTTLTTCKPSPIFCGPSNATTTDPFLCR